MHSAAKSTIASRMLSGGSGGRSPESFWKNTNHGNLIPACRNTPAGAAASASHTHSRGSSPATREIIDLETKPGQIGALAFLRRVEHRARRHQEQRLVDDVREGVRRGAVQRHLGTDADAG